MSRRLEPRRRLSRPQWAISIGLALAVIGFVAAAQWNSSLAREVFTTSAQKVLTAQADQLQREQESLREQIEEAQESVRSFQERGEGTQSLLEELNAEVEAARLAAGLVEVQGPGAVIEIADSLQTVPPGENRTNFIVLVDDLRDIVTALWASGAEAISIAGSANPDAPAERLVATTSIYGVGSAILVNDARLSPPYRIEAIGSDGLHERFLSHPVFLSRALQRIEAFGLQFASEARDDVRIPGFLGNTRLRWGTPVAEPT